MRQKLKSFVAALAAFGMAATVITQESATPKHPPAAPPSAAASRPAFELYQAEAFSAPGGQPLQWADVDGDSDLDLFIGFGRGQENRLYLNDNGKFRNVAAAVGLADT